MYATLVGDQGSEWQTMRVALGASDMLTYLKVVAVKGRLYSGDIAIDDVILRKGLC